VKRSTENLVPVGGILNLQEGRHSDEGLKVAWVTIHFDRHGVVPIYCQSFLHAFDIFFERFFMLALIYEHQQKRIRKSHCKKKLVRSKNKKQEGTRRKTKE
jgi:hypothetical protein